MHRPRIARRAPRPWLLATLLVPATLAALRSPQDSRPATQAATAPSAARPFVQDFPGLAHTLELVPVPGDQKRGLAPFWISRTEIPWELYDAFVYPPEAGDPGVVDAISRPSKPYVPPDRGYGHAGYAAISVTHRNAQAFCRWLRAKTGRPYRLPSEDEWEHAARGGTTGAYAFGDDPRRLGEFAWFADNSGDAPHPIGKKAPNGYGLLDVHGNVAEWVNGRDGKPVLKGGAFGDPAARLRLDARSEYDPAWQETDPQVPKSKWWLSDAPFAGLRVVCDHPAPSRK